MNIIEVCNEFFILIFKLWKFLKNLIDVSLTIVKPLAIKSKRDDSNVISSPNVSNIGLTPILEKVKGLFTPKSDNKVLDNKPSFSNLLDDTNALFDDELDNIPNISDNIDNSTIDNNYVKNIWDGIDWNNKYITSLDNKSFNINLNDIWQVTKAIHITTSDNHHVIYNFEDLNINTLDNKIVKLDITNKIPKILEHFPNVKIKEVIIEDLNNNYNTITIE